MTVQSRLTQAMQHIEVHGSPAPQRRRQGRGSISAASLTVGDGGTQEETKRACYSREADTQKRRRQRSTAPDGRCARRLRRRFEPAHAFRVFQISRTTFLRDAPNCGYADKWSMSCSSSGTSGIQIEMKERDDFSPEMNRFRPYPLTHGS